MDFERVIELVKSTKEIILNDDLRNSIKVKGAADFVTDVDYSISSFLGRSLSEIYPEIGFMSEEESIENLPPTRWILDPIDGTTNLIYDYKMSSVSLALLKNNEIVFGVIYNPFNDDIFSAQKGKGAYLNGKPISINDRDISDCIIEFGAGSTHKNVADLAFENAKNIFLNCLDIRRICSTALSISFISAGRINGYFEEHIKPWDYAAASLLLTEAGGYICSWDGSPLQFDNPSGVIAGSPKAFEFLKKTIKKSNEF